MILLRMRWRTSCSRQKDGSQKTFRRQRCQVMRKPRLKSLRCFIWKVVFHLKRPPPSSVMGSPRAQGFLEMKRCLSAWLLPSGMRYFSITLARRQLENLLATHAMTFQASKMQNPLVRHLPIGGGKIPQELLLSKLFNS